MVVASPLPSAAIPPRLARTAVVRDPDSARDALLWRLTPLRQTRGLSALTLNPILTQAAEAWSTTMAVTSALRHSPALVGLLDAGFNRAGENVGHTDDSVLAIFEGFTASPPHLLNLIDPRWTSVGIAVVVAGDELWVTMEFGTTVACSATASAPASTVASAPTSTAARRSHLNKLTAAERRVSAR